MTEARAAARRAAARTMAVDIATAELIAALRGRDVPAVVMKGPATARALGRARSYRDVDVLVREPDWPEVEATLRSLGYTGPTRGAYDGLAAPTGIEHVRAHDGMIVDVHATVHGAAVSSAAVWDAMIEHVSSVLVRDVDVPVLDGAAVAYLLPAHAAHHGQAGRKPLEDLARGIDVLGDDVWRGAHVLARRLDATGWFATGLRLDRRGEALLERLELDARVSVEAILAAGSPPPSALGWQRVLAARGVGAKARAFAAEALPPREYLATRTRLDGRRGDMTRGHAGRALRVLREAGPALVAVARARREAARRSAPR